MKIKVKFHSENNAVDLTPRKATAGAAGFDLRSAEEGVVQPGRRLLVGCGFDIEVESGYEAQVRPRSGLALKHGITVLNAPGTIDEDYRGPVGVILYNAGTEPFVVRKGDRIAQMVVCPVVPCVIEVAVQLSDTVRGVGGYGSTGVK